MQQAGSAARIGIGSGQGAVLPGFPAPAGQHGAPFAFHHPSHAPYAAAQMAYAYQAYQAAAGMPPPGSLPGATMCKANRPSRAVLYPAPRG